MYAATMDSARKGINDKLTTLNNHFRTMVRLLCLRDSGEIPEAEWAEIMTVPREKEPKVKHQHVGVIIENEVSNLTPFFSPKFSEGALVDLCCAILQNANFMNLPPLEIETEEVEPQIEPGLAHPGLAHPGLWPDPLAAVVKHSRDPNCRFLFEGAELRARALRDISANEELISSDPLPPEINSATRREILKKRRNIDCKCHLCLSPPNEPQGTLKQ
ncbi:hypothetical protein BDZ45DRAFT_764346 [Acephala macrosclerotiorum]|nr:hypothetical protein BDZ45DRAFT_764346 [Acephala macrosclerotiorum]